MPDHDYLINATGPSLDLGAAPGLGPDGQSHSMCTAAHATDASAALQASIARMREGARQVLVVGTGHGTCTCEGAAFEYAFNVEHGVRQAGVRDPAGIVSLANAYELGDFGVDGISRLRLRHARSPVPGSRTRGLRRRRRGQHRPALRSERIHDGRRRLLGQALRGVAGRGLAPCLPGTRDPLLLRGGDRVPPAGSRVRGRRPPARSSHPRPHGPGCRPASRATRRPGASSP